MPVMSVSSRGRTCNLLAMESPLRAPARILANNSSSSALLAVATCSACDVFGNVRRPPNHMSLHWTEGTCHN